MQFVKHLTLRAFAIIVVNTIVFTPFMLFLGRFVIINAILWALAIDYLIVGALALIVAFVVEPYLERMLEGEKQLSLVYHGINAFLLVAAIVTLWSSIWTAPNMGECLLSPTAGFGDPTPDCPLNAHFFFSFFFGQGKYFLSA